MAMEVLSALPATPNHNTVEQAASSITVINAAQDDGFTTATSQSVPCATSNLGAVADKLGISITPNDYQLLTDPHLANYVTDESTEAQLLG